MNRKTANFQMFFSSMQQNRKTKVITKIDTLIMFISGHILGEIFTNLGWLITFRREVVSNVNIWSAGSGHLTDKKSLKNRVHPQDFAKDLEILLLSKPPYPSFLFLHHIYCFHSPYFPHILISFAFPICWFLVAFINDISSSQWRTYS